MNDLSTAEMLRITEVLREKKVNFGCPSCLNVMSLQKELVAVKLTYGRTAEYAVVACQACGHVRHHSLHILNVIHHKPKQPL